jgi:putative transcriptional regulator
MISVEHNPGDPPIDTGTDWAAINALTEEQIHAAALSDPDAQPLPVGPEEEMANAGLRRIPSVRRLREQLGLTQEAFAAAYRIPVGTLRDWEQGRKFPDATARAYLTVIERDPEAVLRALGQAA